MRRLDVIDFGPGVEAFRNDVVEGLRQPQKWIPCKYFYDEKGAQLFEEICELDEYYPTRTELGIMDRYVGEMAECIGPRCLLIEYGAGSGIKTRILMEALEEPAGYVPIDISGDQLAEVATSIRASYPGLEVIPVCADYTGHYELPPVTDRASRHVVYFPGSTIGNFEPERARGFLRHIREVCGRSGGLLIGVDLKKDKRVLERAYNDASGVTAAFNKNLLRRMNRELGADCRVSGFRHRAFYNETEGRIEMHLESTREQLFRIDGDSFTFEEGETIHTENSYKYGLEDFAILAEAAGLRVERVWNDDARLFSVQYLVW